MKMTRQSTTTSWRLIEGEAPDFYRGRAAFWWLQEPEGEPYGPLPALPPGADEQGSLGPLDRVPRHPRNPVTYPHLTWDEIDGTRYPGEGADLSQFSDYKRMTRLCQCYETEKVMSILFDNWQKWMD